MVGGLDVLYVKHRRRRLILPVNRNQWKINSNRNPYPNSSNKAQHFEYDQNEAAMGAGDGETE